MSTEQKTISITRALASLKSLDSKIEKALSKIELITLTKGEENFKVLHKGSMTVEQKEKEIKENYQSLKDLITQRSLIKSKVMESNSKTKVKIGNQVMTVAEAIEQKNSISYKQTLLSHMKQQSTVTEHSYQLYQKELNTQIENAITAYAGKDRKISSEEVEVVTKPLKTKSNPEVLDPLNLNSLIKSLTTEVEDFLENVDYALSESNAITTIEL